MSLVRDESLETGAAGISRRTVNRAVIWSIPVVAAAVATPMAAASVINVNLSSTARLPIDPDGRHAANAQSPALAYYAGPRTCEMQFTFRNDGPDDLPAGALLTIGLPFASIWETSTFTILSSGGHDLVPAGEGTQDISTADGPTALRRLLYFTLATPLPAGSFFNLSFTIQMNGTENSATNFYQVRTYANLTPGEGVTETDPSNNASFSTNYAFFNRASASAP